MTQNTIDDQIPTPESINWGTVDGAQEQKALKAEELRQLRIKTLIAVWFDKLQRKFIDDTEIGFISNSILRGQHDVEDDLWEYSGQEVLDAVLLLEENGWQVTPKTKSYQPLLFSFLTIKKFQGIELRKAPADFTSNRDFHKSWTQKLE